MFHISPGDVIGVMAPSSYVEKDDIEKSKALLESKGYDVFIHPQTFARQNQSAGTHKDKLDALHSLYADESIRAIWAAGGGNRSLYLLDDLDYELIAKKPKPLIGFSDASALLNAIYANTGIEGFHAQVFKRLHDFEQLDETLCALSGKCSSMPMEEALILRSGHAEGVIIGGCLSLFHYLPGTNDCPNMQGAILLLEDSSDEISRFDRMFAHMKRMGVFEQIGGLVLGEFHDTKDSVRPFGFSLEDIVLEALDGRDIPIIFNAPFGHGKNLWPVPIGRNGILDTTAMNLRFTNLC
ncbi:MAG: LD-carboxypeptidase [Rhodospirillales bacterium]|nr:LD-carboxypeptidase [Alphaproteobacteria bacterium]USO06406.1 MAG: LD-carboxypeptidase [Rhodospirillales bacterium]HOO51053.1 LD-carboxypeptidase [Alphaproteobacteria bacterium]